MILFEGQRLLVIAPHPDDEALGCAGLMKRVKDAGGKVYVIFLVVGDIKQYGGESSTVVRKKEMEAAMKFMNIDDFELLFEGDEYHLNLDTIPRKKIIDVIENDSKISMNKIKPTIVAIPQVSTNQDHEAVFKACMAVCRPRPDKASPNIILCYEQPETFWHKTEQPNFYVDISDVLQFKLDAVSLYKSQLRKEPHPRSIENILRIAELRGRDIGTKAAEAFFAQKFVV